MVNYPRASGVGDEPVKVLFQGDMSRSLCNLPLRNRNTLNGQSSRKLENRPRILKDENVYLKTIHRIITYFHSGWKDFPLESFCGRHYRTSFYDA